MSKVFFDLEFAKMDSGQIIINEVVEKRNLDESLVYQQKVEEITTRKKNCCTPIILSFIVG